jgi:hypothetical protein
MMTNNVVYFRQQSDNSKVGPIPVSTSGRQTCPDACDLKGNGCYAENFPLKIHWDKVTRGEKGYVWADFLGRVRKLRKNQIWRHNQAGDLVGHGNTIDEFYLTTLVTANSGRRGFTYTHYPMDHHNAFWVRMANENGFTINLSADTVAEADRLASLSVGPVVTMLPLGEVPRETPGGRKITQCPAQTVEYMTCAVCQLCQDPNRKAIVGFVAHGARRKTVHRLIEIKQEKNHES